MICSVGYPLYIYSSFPYTDEEGPVLQKMSQIQKTGASHLD